MVKRESIFQKLLIYLCLLLVLIVTMVPLVWIISASLKSNNQIFVYPIEWIPRHPKWSNYSTVWQKLPLLTYVRNSAKLTICVTLIQLFTCSFAAYGFAKCRFKGRGRLFILYIATMAIPWQSYMVAQYVMMSKLHLVNSHLSYILLKCFSPFGVFLMRQFYKDIPDELLEAARIDGLSEFGIYRRIMLPLSKPALATLTIFTVVNTWNDYMGPYIYLTSNELKTLQIGIKSFVGQYSTEYGYIVAATLLSLIPITVVYIAFQRFLIEGIATSGIKG